MTEVDYHVPEYTLEEREKEIIIVIVAPLGKPKEAAFVLEKNVFTFDSPPYLLKIKLPHPVSDRFSQQAYDNETRTYKVKLKKTSETQQEDTDDEEEEEILNSGSKPAEEASEIGEKQFYGFANMYTNMFGKLYNEFSEVINLPDPDHTKVEDRRNLREKEENEKWDEDHYLADTMETDHLESIFNYKPPWVTSPLTGDFRSDETEILQELINKSKISKLSKESVRLCEIQIVDILYSYAYNVRTTEGDNTVESGWTINRLSSTLSWLEVFEDLKSVLLSCYRRSLTFPLYRNWNLTQMVHKDVVNILKAGPKQVTRCFLEVRDVFNESGYCYILNSLYISDLCNFTFHMLEKRCSALAKEVQNIKVKKYEVNPELPILEIAAHLVLEESTDGFDKTNLKDVIDKLSDLNLASRINTSSDSDSSNDDSDSSESSDYED